MMDRFYRYRAEFSMGSENPYDFIFSSPQPLLSNAHWTVVNLEAPVGTCPSQSLNSDEWTWDNITFIMEPITLEYLAKQNINVVNIGNNHMTDFGLTGVETTKKLLTDNDISFFGYNGQQEDSPSIILQRDTLKIGIVNFNEFVPKGEEIALKALKELTDTTMIQIVYCHWGNEFQEKPIAKQRNIAQNFINNGADLIIGSHSHVIQEKEHLNDVPVYYSLGNFIFDQYFSEETRLGLILKVEIDKKGGIVSLQEHMVHMHPSGVVEID
jgi:gamma-polyglutamate biosynthesis protein CapA